jgi:hypothetical protein
MKITLSLLVLLFSITKPAFATEQKESCLNMGDTVTVTGHIQTGADAGTYFVLLKPQCFHYPKRTSHFTPTNLITSGDKLPPDVYVELTGELVDPWPMVGIGIRVKAFRNVDAEVRTALADWKQRCEQWQGENSPALSKQMHGSQVARITNDEYWSLPKARCGILAADANLPHEVTTIWRPEP